MFVTSDFNTFNDLHVLNIYQYNKVANFDFQWLNIIWITVSYFWPIDLQGYQIEAWSKETKYLWSSYSKPSSKEARRGQFSTCLYGYCGNVFSLSYAKNISQHAWNDHNKRCFGMLQPTQKRISSMGRNNSYIQESENQNTNFEVLKLHS